MQKASNKLARITYAVLFGLKISFLGGCKGTFAKRLIDVTFDCLLRLCLAIPYDVFCFIVLLLGDISFELLWGQLKLVLSRTMPYFLFIYLF